MKKILEFIKDFRGFFAGVLVFIFIYNPKIIAVSFFISLFYLIVLWIYTLFKYPFKKNSARVKTEQHLQIAILSILIQLTISLWIIIHPIYIQNEDFMSVLYIKHLMLHLLKENMIYVFALFILHNIVLANHIKEKY